MKSGEYWKQRFESLNQSLLNVGDQYYYGEVEKQFRLATRELEKDISIWYKRLAANNEISMADAKALLTGKNLQEFRWTVQDYIKHGQEHGISGKWARELENASARVHITQLDALKLQMQQQLEVLYGNQVDGLDRRLKDIYSEGFYKTVYEVGKGASIGSQLRQLDAARLKNVISKPWCSDGKTFSDRLWRDKDTLNSTLQREFSQAVIRGEGLDTVVKNLSDRMSVATSAAGRLVMTESAFFASAGQADCFEALGVKQYEFIATLDDRTSPECQDMDGKVFDMKDMQPGVNAPPLHCWCRSCIAPYFEDDKGTRAARGKDGKTEQVPGNMTYPEWKNKFIADETKSIEKPNDESYNEGIKRTCQRALAHGQRTGNELLSWTDKNGNTPYPDLSGNSNSVQFTQDLIGYLNRAPEKSLACIHNHPSSSSFSDADLGIMARFSSIERMQVIGHDGTEYMASIDSGVRPTFDDISKSMKQAIADLMSEFGPRVISGELSRAEAWKEHTHRAMQEVAKKYKWKYERRLQNEKG